MHHHGFGSDATRTGGADSDVTRGIVSFDWDHLKRRRDAYVERLNGIYERNLIDSGVVMLHGTARLERGGGGGGGVVVSVSPGKAGTTTGGTTARDRHYTAEHILLATGGRPTMPEGVVGASRYAITSDGFFDMPSLPAKSAIVGGGYIAVELAGILNALGSDTSLVLRRGRALGGFDDMISDALDAEMKRRGIRVHANTSGIDRIEAETVMVGPSVNGTSSSAEKMKLFLNDGTSIEGVDVVVVAIGRSPCVESLNLAEVGVAQKKGGGYVVTNEYSETTVAGVYAVGDVTGNVGLTPIGERLSLSVRVNSRPHPLLRVEKAQ